MHEDITNYFVKRNMYLEGIRRTVFQIKLILCELAVVWNSSEVWHVTGSPKQPECAVCTRTQQKLETSWFFWREKYQWSKKCFYILHWHLSRKKNLLIETIAMKSFIFAPFYSNFLQQNFLPTTINMSNYKSLFLFSHFQFFYWEGKKGKGGMKTPKAQIFFLKVNISFQFSFCENLWQKIKF